MSAVSFLFHILRTCVLAAGCAVLTGRAQALAIPDGETAQAPSYARLNAVLEAAKRDGWGPQVVPLRIAALRAYDRNFVAAEAWFNAYSWARLWGESEAHFVARWVPAINAAKAGHPGMSRDIPARPVPMGAALSPALQQWLFSEQAFSREFFANVTSVDCLPRVFEILDALNRSSPAQFKAYPNLALAIALVFDVPPPPHWPHFQVSAEALPRTLPDPVVAFRWWVQQEQQGRLAAPLKHRPVAELKYVVDATAPFAELDWARTHLLLSRAAIPQVYDAVKYRMERLSQPMWPGSTYRLADILARGGICPDQAYFAAQVGKARGMPTLLFHGAGAQGRHAWIGYLDVDRQWHLDVGRYAEQRYVTGYALDPQTWTEFSDHELQFLKQHFRASTTYRQSRVHQAFAADFFAAGNLDAAATAARQAVRFEPRAMDAWDILFEVERRRRSDPKPAENVLREAALAFRAYPDLEAHYLTRVADSLRQRGQTSEADAEIRHLAHKHESGRVDLTVRQARDMVLRAMDSEPLTGQVRSYNAVVEAYAPRAGIAFFDEVVRLFVEHLVQLQNRMEAQRALERARALMKFEAHSQLETEFARLEQVVNAIPVR